MRFLVFMLGIVFFSPSMAQQADATGPGLFTQLAWYF